MNVRDILDSFLGASQNQNNGMNSASNQASNNEQQAMLSGMGKGALAAGALALLLGSKKGRKFTKGALKVGSVAALGGLAYSAYNKWQSNSNQSSAGAVNTPSQLTNSTTMAMTAEQQQFHDTKLLQAVIAAAKADGHIDDNERATIEQQMEKMGNTSEVNSVIQEELNKPLNPADIAAGIESPELAAEVYMVTKMLTDDSNFMERSYVQELSSHLNLAPELMQELDRQINV